MAETVHPTDPHHVVCVGDALCSRRAGATETLERICRVRLPDRPWKFWHQGEVGAAADAFREEAIWRALGLGAGRLLLSLGSAEVASGQPVEKSLESVRACMDLLSDLPVAAVKTGALGNGAVAGAVARALEGWKGFLVVDPVVLPKSGAPLSDLGDLDGFRPLFARADLLLPNLDEAALLLGRPVGSAEEMPGAADELKERFGSEAVLLKGGHLAGPETVDHLRTAEGTWTWRSPRIVSHHTHGTGCALASSIAARWALGRPLPVAVEEGREWLRRAIGQAPGLGSGNGPLDLFA